ncbi:UNVERIFIED_CONTAM: hypothetical protein PYX00_004760 [Menopon gallinae]|uniref:Uncharacterized protein n=1 Tax=Menopon gallinae TaxID=328185 RepID=A0AAW2I6S9_9NEOP
MVFRFAIAIVLALAVDRCESLLPADADQQQRQQTTELRATGADLSESGDFLEEVIDYIIEDNNVFEGRKKKIKKKMLKYLSAAVLFKALLIPKMLALVKFFVAKAYFISMMALVFAAAVTAGGKTKEKDTEQVIDLLPKGRAHRGQGQAYRYWRRQQQEGR